jgi:hypothetical protein
MAAFGTEDVIPSVDLPTLLESLQANLGAFSPFDGGSNDQVRNRKSRTSVPYPDSKHNSRRPRWFSDLTCECSRLAEYAGVRIANVGSELARKLITEPHPAVEVR